MLHPLNIPQNIDKNFFNNKIAPIIYAGKPSDKCLNDKKLIKSKLYNFAHNLWFEHKEATKNQWVGDVFRHNYFLADYLSLDKVECVLYYYQLIFGLPDGCMNVMFNGSEFVGYNSFY
jgi:hypothetical protein